MSKAGLQMAGELIRMRQKYFEDERDDAIRVQNWSKVSGFDGIVTGLMIAARIVAEEIIHENNESQL